MQSMRAGGSPTCRGLAATDRVGDLSRSFLGAAVAGTPASQLSREHGSRLSHELHADRGGEIPLENLHLESMPESAQTYIGRAEAGLGRLTGSSRACRRLRAWSRAWPPPIRSASTFAAW